VVVCLFIGVDLDRPKRWRQRGLSTAYRTIEQVA
ncbi:uncharacterized protein METZ01_LOCUS464, partial [marine metagenome]